MPTKRTIRAIGPASEETEADVAVEKSDEPPSSCSAGAGSGDGYGATSGKRVPPPSPPLQSNPVRLPALVPIRNGAPPPAIEKPVNIDQFTLPQQRNEATGELAVCSSGADDSDADTGAAGPDPKGVYSTDLPLIALFGPPRNPIGSDQPAAQKPAAPTEIVIGRRHVLMPFYRACGCCNTSASETSARTVGQKRNRMKRLSLCDDCRSIEDWGTKFLSRAMVRLTSIVAEPKVGSDDASDEHISSFRVQARGENAQWFVKVDNKPVVPPPPPGQPDDAWRGDSILSMGSELTLGFADGDNGFVGAGLVFRLVGVTVELRASVAKIGKVKQPEGKVVKFGSSTCIEPPAIDVRNAQTPEPEQEKDNKVVKCDPSLSIEEEAERTDPVAEPAHDAPAATEVQTPEKSTTTPGLASVQTPEKSTTTPELSPVQESGAIDLTESPPLQALDGALPSQDIIDISDTPGEADSKKETRQCKVFFLQLGRSMSQRRVQQLMANLERKDGDIQVTDAFAARSGVTHVIIDENVSPLQVATALGFIDLEQMKKVFTKRRISAVKPEWIIKSADVHDEPTFDEYWAGLHGVGQDASKKRPLETIEPENETGSDASTGEVEADDEFAPVSVVKASSVKGDDTVSRMFKRRKEEARRRNQGLFEMFMELSKLHKECPLERKDDWKQKLYAKVAWRLRYLDYEVVYRKDVLDGLRKIDGNGESAMNKINEYLMTGSCMKIQEFKTNPERIAVRNIMKIHGVGKIKAAELAKQKYATIDDVREGLSSGKIDLSPVARYGVSIYEDLLDRMDRSEVEEIAALVSKAFRENHSTAKVIIMGSYRRGNQSCGDCDLLIVDPDYEETTPQGALGELVDRMKLRGHIAHHLNKVEGMEGVSKKKTSDRNVAAESDHAQSWMGVFFSPRHEGRHRRVDIKVYPWQDRAYAALYFTGNTAFNRSMRTYAQHRKNMALSDHGLFPINRSGKLMPHEEKKQYRTNRIPASEEEEIFEHLSLVYRGPTERKCFDDVIEK